MTTDPPKPPPCSASASSPKPSTRGSPPPNAASSSVNWPVRLRTPGWQQRPTRAARSIAGSAPIASRASTDSDHHPRADLGVVRRHPELLDEACQLREELPARSAAQIGAILNARHGISVPERTIREHLQRRGLHRAALAGQPRAFGRYEADRPNERWIGDVLVGPFVPFPRVAGSKRAYFFLLVDDFAAPGA